MKRILILSSILLLLSSHDLYLKPEHYFCDPHSPITLALYNGTFFTSENIIARDRMRQVRIEGPGATFEQATASWRDHDQITFLDVQTARAGTYVAAISIFPRPLELTAEEFNEYLEHDGVLDVLKERQASGDDATNVRELYAKHVKTIFQVGSQRSTHYGTVFNDPVEFVPVTNPYELTLPADMEVRLLGNGRPLTGQLVYLGQGHHQGHHEENGHEHHDTQLRTDQNGMIEIRIDRPGTYYLRTIHMIKSRKDDFDYESNWATLTFEVR
jgi:hypothetical protein